MRIALAEMAHSNRRFRGWRYPHPAPQDVLLSRIMTAQLPLAPDLLASLCRRHHIRRLSLFGSMLKGTARPDSDVDLLVEFEPGARPSFFDLADIEQELSALLGGRRVDVRTAKDLSRYFRDEVVRDAEVQYESACPRPAAPHRGGRGSGGAIRRGAQAQ
jgi:uncharacterized protein